MDALDRLAEPGLDLLTRVDTLLAAGAPEGHRLWPLLRRLQVLPGEAVGQFLELHPAPLADAGHAVRQLVRGYDDACALLADPVAWSGPAASAYDEARGALLRHLDEGPESLVGRLESTAGYADALADWVEGSRLALARALADVLRSAEAVTVHAATRPGVDAGQAAGLAAAEIAARVLGVIGVAYDGAENLLRQWAPNLAETTWRDRPRGAPHFGGATRIGR
ncbi:MULTISPECIES: hypothetical protein [Micromonospora]|uniref:Uncharacterized protein n=1 Tax=Micromonospora solifontis TaxID=2487138 RepID=A0ABX9WRB3_9ACTN|nr:MULTISPECIES: hypothetical protein [Micromonospora]NES13231.1 hypothetical protein [Micromonospora sp. PPF5-17B]NES34600.1 hypothetical protein [Micromonospora solifontis]NES57036.1 hypothetical protein [Micromonospora sp. PPF5-6]RNM01851.1 hypothetical protein EFE23_00245 [Micromonospora solifontis]